MGTYVIFHVLTLVLTMAILDSINPCTFAIYTSLLIMASTIHGKTRRQVKIVGLSFILGVFVAYYLLGLGFLAVLGFLDLISKVIGLVAMVFGLYLLLTNVSSRGCKIEVKHLKYVRNAVNPYLAFIIGGFLGLTLLPCSGGPYVVTLTVMEKFKLPYYYEIILLTIYNTVFILPLALILAGIYHVWKLVKGKERAIKIIEGLILIGLGIYIFFLWF